MEIRHEVRGDEWKKLVIQRVVDTTPTQLTEVQTQSNGGVAIYQTDVDGETSVVLLDGFEKRRIIEWLTASARE